MKSGALQAKLRIGQTGDVYEQEADRVADAVMRMPEPGVQPQPIEERKKKQYPVRGHPKKSSMSLEEIEKFLGLPKIEKVGKNMNEFWPYLSQFARNEFEVPVVFPEKKTSSGVKGPRKWVALKGSTYLTGTTIFVARESYDNYLFVEYIQSLSLWIVRHYGKENCENRIAELMNVDPKLKDRLRQKVVEK